MGLLTPVKALSINTLTDVTMCILDDFKSTRVDNGDQL